MNKYEDEAKCYVLKGLGGLELHKVTWEEACEVWALWFMNRMLRGSISAAHEDPEPGSVGAEPGRGRKGTGDWDSQFMNQ